MERFWLGTCHQPTGATGRLSDPLAAEGIENLAIEILEDEGRYVVLISAADQLAAPHRLHCRIGFSNSARACNLWRSRGFLVIEAAIRYQGETLDVFSPFFSDAGAIAMRYGELLLSIEGVRFGAAGGPAVEVSSNYHQFLESPERGRSATRVLRRKVQWNIGRSEARAVEARPLTIRAPRTRSPNLMPIQTGALAITHAWSGVWAGDPVRVLSPDPPAQASRADLFGASAFRFREVEVLGFRLRLNQSPTLSADLRELIAPLNFNAPGVPAGFRFKVATPVVLIELLRYGRMQLAGPQPPLGEQDFQSQHELVVRVQVGKVDSGQTRTRDHAVHVPAIFVDNPWSKIVGRDLQGFEKCLADFCVRDGQALRRLRPDGRLQPDAAESGLADIKRVNLVDLVSNDATSGNPAMLEIGYSNLQPPKWNASPDFQAAADPADVVWSSGDVNDDTQLGALAPLCVGSRYQCIQSTPVDDRGLDPALISATCDLRDLEWTAPAGTASLTFHVPDGAPRGWKLLCRLLGATQQTPVTRDFGRLSWYRLKFSMNLNGQDQ